MGTARPTLHDEAERAARKEARLRFCGDRDAVIERYRAGTPMSALAREYRVSPYFARARFEEWNEPIRGIPEARASR